MKKSELTQLTQVIEHLVVREIKKQLPKVISEVFQNMIQKPMINETKVPEEKNKIKEEIGTDNFRTSLKELFSGEPAEEIESIEEVRQPVKNTRHFTKDPILNQILNETTPDLRQREGMVGAAAMYGGYSPMIAPSAIENAHSPVLVEGQESSHVPPSQLPSGISALDLKQHAPPAVKTALTRNYSEMMKLIDKKKKGIA